MAARRGKRVVTMSELEDAKDKVMMGAERRSMAMSDEEKKLTAFHEAGHAIVAISVEGSDPIHKATIIPRGRALGMVMRLPGTRPAVADPPEDAGRSGGGLWRPPGRGTGLSVMKR
jgi:ATP-dependent Zn protease